MELARLKAFSQNLDFVDTDHLLLGILELGQGSAFNIFRRLDCNLSEAPIRIEHCRKTAEQRHGGHGPYSVEAEAVLALAVKEAKSLNHRYVGTEHLLLGLAGEGQEVLRVAFEDLGLELKVARQLVLRELDPNYLPDGTG